MSHNFYFLETCFNSFSFSTSFLSIGFWSWTIVSCSNIRGFYCPFIRTKDVFMLCFHITSSPICLSLVVSNLLNVFGLFHLDILICFSYHSLSLFRFYFYINFLCVSFLFLFSIVSLPNVFLFQTVLVLVLFLISFFICLSLFLFSLYSYFVDKPFIFPPIFCCFSFYLLLSNHFLSLFSFPSPLLRDGKF